MGSRKDGTEAEMRKRGGSEEAARREQEERSKRGGREKAYRRGGDQKRKRGGGGHRVSGDVPTNFFDVPTRVPTKACPLISV